MTRTDIHTAHKEETRKGYKILRGICQGKRLLQRYGDITRVYEMGHTNDTGRFIMFSVITNVYNKKTKGPTLMEFFTATGKLNFFFLTTRDVRCVHHG